MSQANTVVPASEDFVFSLGQRDEASIECFVFDRMDALTQSTETSECSQEF